MQLIKDISTRDASVGVFAQPRPTTVKSWIEIPQRSSISRPTEWPKINLLKSSRRRSGASIGARRVPRPRRGHAVRTTRSWRGIVPFTHLAREGRMTVTIGRRGLLVALGGAAAAWPLATRAQQAERVRRIGLLMVADDREGQARARALKQGLQELGWIEGRNIQIETRFAGADAGRMRAEAAELVALAPEVVVGNTTPVVRALRQATSSIPIIMAAVNDPVEQGVVSSLAHPGGDITGFMFIDFQMVGKWLEMLKEVAPGVSRAELMFNPDTSPHYYVYLRSFEAVSRSIAIEVAAAPVHDTAEIEAAFAKLGRDPGGGLI